MIVTLSTGTTYDLSDSGRTQTLRAYLAKLKRLGKQEDLDAILRQVRPYATYAGQNTAYINARRIFDGLQSLGLVPAPAPVVIRIQKVVASAAPSALPRPVPARSEANPIVTSNQSDTCPLYLPAMKSGTIYCITIAPMNSSGDIYHMLAYLMLALHENPQAALKFQLNYDRAVSVKDKQPVNSALSVGDQVKRSMDFADFLGLGDYFIEQKLEYNNTGRTIVRETVLAEHFTTRANAGERICVIDQMATTVMIACRIQEIGYKRVSKILREGFSQRNSAVISQNMLDTIDGYVTKEMTAIAENRGPKKDRPLIILHIRFSSKANEGQNLPDTFVTSFIKFITNKPYCYQVYLITADDRARGGYEDESGYSFNPFMVKLFENNRDHTKLLHLSLLTRLQQLPNTVGVIGNTSGTLDVAALLGLNTYNIHRFTESKITYQECRLFFQLTFLSVGALNIEFPDVFSEALEQWILKPRRNRDHEAFEKPKQETSLLELILTEKDDINGGRKLFAATFFAPQKSPRSVPLIVAESTVKRLFQEQKSEEAASPGMHF